MASRYLETREVALDLLTPFPGNARRGDTDRIRESLRANGQYRALVVRKHGGPVDVYTVLAGNHTLAALRLEGAETARCELVECDEDTALRINLVDNRAAELGTYDDDALAALLRELDDPLGSGWTDTEVAQLLADESPVPLDTEHVEFDAAVSAEDDEFDAEPPAEPVTRAGDVWVLGSHRIVCGDCRDADTVTRLLDGRRINIAFTSPPYAAQRVYDSSSGFKPIPPDEYVDWFADVQANVRANLADDGSWFVNIKASADGLDTYLYVHDLVIAHARQWGWHYATEFCWERPGVPKSVVRRFKNQFEPVFQFALGAWKTRPGNVMHTTQTAITPLGVGAGNTGWANRQGTDLGFSDDRYEPGMAYPGNRLPTFAGTHRATGHTAAFPVGLPAWFIRAYTDPGDVVFDPFMGSGSTLLAAHGHGRVAYGAEISPAYCDIICRRFQMATGELPVLQSTGEAHDFAPVSETAA